MKDKNSLGYILGQAFAFVTFVCFSTLVVGATIKIIAWMLG